MNYYEIGQRIRKYRKEKGLSQEQLAEAVNISVTHMSHIETGNTKLSLPVLVDIALALKITADDLLSDSLPSDKNAADKLIKLLSDCSDRQLQLITEVAKAIKNNTPF
ncbi:MAG: helix-turn-helix transcriptional regulator [Oscillospiraceae bacterium]|nr:helix-turn-helix transcriptional regulator [Oscillospiraceae bacterium]